MNLRVYIANLPATITEALLQTTFAPFGAIAKIFVATDRDTGVPRGFAFVTYGTAEEASAAIAGMNGVEMEGRALTVSLAREPAPPPVRYVPPPPPRRTGSHGAPRGQFRR